MKSIQSLRNGCGEWNYISKYNCDIQCGKEIIVDNKKLYPICDKCQALLSYAEEVAREIKEFKEDFLLSNVYELEIEDNRCAFIDCKKANEGLDNLLSKIEGDNHTAETEVRILSKPKRKEHVLSNLGVSSSGQDTANIKTAPLGSKETTFGSIKETTLGSDICKCKHTKDEHFHSNFPKESYCHLCLCPRFQNGVSK